ncbi:HTH domain-containing protein [uncultured Polaribacter sp.]|uniref:GntR family transcriptional regulator n=1 Tax=uncultured Polaribacter sp. TaxID=174711 RepID=UPI0026075B1F|nr:HTH domain-containing protein [uncultured Polaribacter sp.]
MKNELFVFNVNQKNKIPKYIQLVNAINNAITENLLKKGDALLSVSEMSKHTKLSRDTVFRAYKILKENGTIDSVPTRGYYVASNIKKVLLVLDTFKAYKEVVYHAFVKELPDNITTDMYFHHYDIDNLKVILENSKGEYYKYIVMPFNHKEMSSLISDLDNDKLLLLDWNIHSNNNNNYVFQDFGKAFFKTLKIALNSLRKFKEIVFLYPDFTYHPKETLTYLKKFCIQFEFKYKIIKNPNSLIIKKDIAYISLSDRMLGFFLEQCKAKNLEPGIDVGFLSYNETPMKKFIYKGISVVSTDFEELGKKAAEFVLQDNKMQYYVPTKLILRESL